MMGTIHPEVLLAGGYAVFLVGLAAALEAVARHSHRRSEQYRNRGFVYRAKFDVWECPAGEDLRLEQMDYERRLARYRAPAHRCNACSLKANCTDSDEGRLVERRLDAWLESELRRFHRGISLALVVLATLLLTIETLRYRDGRDWMLSVGLLVPIAIGGSRLIAELRVRGGENIP